jgi:hypothetical protein
MRVLQEGQEVNRAMQARSDGAFDDTRWVCRFAFRLKPS